MHLAPEIARRFLHGIALPAALCMAFAATAEAATRVRFIAPQNYTDGNLSWGPVDQRLTLEGLDRIITRLENQYIPKGYDLDVEILDIDLAGKIDPLISRTGQLRVMRGDTWPTIKLRYVLRKGSRVVARGEDTLRSMNYLMDPIATRSNESLRFEKAMLANWLHQRFASIDPAS